MHSELDHLRQAIASATRGMSVEDLARRPLEGKWCAAEVLEHLYLTHARTVKGCERCLAANRPLATTANLRQRLRKAVVMTTGRMPSGRSAPEGTRPGGLRVPTILAEFEAKLGRMDELLTQCEARYGRGVRILDHPILGPLTTSQWRKFHRIHGMHHAKQLTQLQARRSE
jgi:hypothetical protein